MYIIKLGKAVAAVSFVEDKSFTSFRCVNEVGFVAVGCPVFAAEFDMIDGPHSANVFARDCSLTRRLEESHIPSIVARMDGGAFYIDSTVKDTFFYSGEPGDFPMAYIDEFVRELPDGRKVTSIIVENAEGNNLDHIDFFIGEVEDASTRDYLNQFLNKASEVSDGLLDDDNKLFRLIRDLNDIIRKDVSGKCDIRVASFDFKDEARLLGLFPADK